jgi:putative SOS response-associated peptidase YedK
VAEKASFRGAWRHRRCLLPTDGFLEKGWLIRRLDRQPFWLAGIWDRWIGPDGSELESCCVLTASPNALVKPLHQRMPVLLPDGLEQQSDRVLDLRVVENGLRCDAGDMLDAGGGQLVAPVGAVDRHHVPPSSMLASAAPAAATVVDR